MIKKILLLLFLLISLSIFGNKGTSAQTLDCQDISDLSQKITCLENKTKDLQSQKKTLSSQIAVFDNQIRLTEYRIEATEQQISDLALDIDTTTKKIGGLEKTLDTLAGVLANRIVATYEVGRIQPLQILLTSDSISNFFSRLNYLKIAQQHDKTLIYNTQQAKNDYANQKEIFEAKKRKVETLKNQLMSYTAQLTREKRDKQALLEVTKNNEATYQQMLQSALAEQRAIQQIAAGGGNAVSVGRVKEGDLIGYMISGKSACSSGTHLHFEVRKDGGIHDPSQYLSNKSVTFENSPDGSFSFGGSWSWPLSDPIFIEQGFGMTYWARIGWYAGGPHTGLDLYSNSSLAVNAVKDGELFRGSIACGGGQLPFSRVDQADGIQTYYLHIGPN